MTLTPQQLDELRKKSIATPLTPEENAAFAADSNAIYDPQRAAASAKTAAAKLAAEGNFADLESRIKARVSGENAALTTKYAPMAGFSFNEGLPIAHGNVDSAGVSDISKADIARTLAEADAVLQESQANLDITKEAKGYAQTLADKEFQRRMQEAGLYGQQYATESSLAQNQAQSEAALAQSQAQYDEAQRRAELESNQKLTQVDLGNQIAFVNNKGDVVKSLAKGKVPGSGTGTGAGTTKTYKPTTGFTVSQNSVGGLSFVNNKKQPITAAQYAANFSADGQTVDADVIKQLLSKSGDAGDQQIISDINAGMSYDQLKAKYPWVFNT